MSDGEKVVLLGDVGACAKRVMGEELFYGRYPERWAEHLFTRLAYKKLAALLIPGGCSLPDVVYATKDILEVYPSVLALRIQYLFTFNRVEHMKFNNIDDYLVDSLFSIPEIEFVSALDKLVQSLTKYWPNENTD